MENINSYSEQTTANQQPNQYQAQNQQAEAQLANTQQDLSQLASTLGPYQPAQANFQQAQIPYKLTPASNQHYQQAQAQLAKACWALAIGPGLVDTELALEVIAD